MKLWNNISIGTKQALGFGLIILLLMGLVFIGFQGISEIVRDAEEVIEGNKLNGLLAEKEVDHLNWSNNIIDFLTDEKITELDVETDDKKCSLGQWLLSEERKKAEKLVPGLTPLFKEIMEPHARLHKSALEIKENFVQADTKLPIFLVKKEIDHQIFINKIKDLFIENLTSVDMEQDYKKSDLGKWIYSEKAQKIKKNSPEFNTALEKLKEARKELYESAFDIKKHYKQIHPGLIEELNKIVRDFQVWSAAVSNAILLKNQKIVTEDDPNKSSLGKFIFSQEAKNWMKDFPQLKQSIDACRQSNIRLHISVIEIEKALKEQDVDRATSIYKEKTMNYIKEITENLSDAINAESQLLDSRNYAKEIYLTKTLPASKNTREALEQCIIIADQQVEKMQKANEIYANKTTPALKETQGILAKMLEEVKSHIMTDEVMLKAANETKQNSIIIGIIAIIIGFLMAFTMSRSISGSIKILSGIVRKIATERDLTVKIDIKDRKDEIGTLMDGFKKMLDTIRDQTVQMIDASDTLTSLISQISTTAAEMATTTAETSSAISEISATVEEVRQTTQVSNDKAEHVVENAKKGAETSDVGIKSTEDTIAGIKVIKEEMEYIAESIVKLSEQTQSIGQIISAVNDLADQSNLLSVNASIEAAKAGEHGKGFAVVAMEVKSLAEQSKEATNQVTSILNDIQKATSAAVMATERGSKAVETGVNLSANTEVAIRDLAKTVKESAQVALQIASSNQEQLIGMDQLVEAMDNIKDASTQNADGAKQLEDAIHNLDALTVNLKDLSGQFIV